MKNLAILFLGLTLILGISSCTNKEDSSGTTNPGQVVTTGTWTVTQYFESGENHTSDFAGYTFTFTSDGKVTATISGNVTTGTWSYSDSSTKMVISLGDNDPLRKLSEDWIVLSSSSSAISLKDDNPDKDETVIFTKN